MENATRELEKSQLKKDEIRITLETREIRSNCLKHELNTSNSQMVTLQKCLEESTTKYQFEHQQAGVGAQSLYEKNQRLAQCHEREVLNVEVAQKENLQLKAEIRIQKINYSPDVHIQLQKVTESEKVAWGGQNSLKQILNTERDLRERSEERLEGNLDGIPFTGYADLLLRDKEGNPFILDMKWSGSSRYRKEEVEQGDALQLATYSWLLL